MLVFIYRRGVAGFESPKPSQLSDTGWVKPMSWCWALGLIMLMGSGEVVFAQGTAEQILFGPPKNTPSPNSSKQAIPRQAPSRTSKPVTFAPAQLVKQLEPAVITGAGQSANSTPALLTAQSAPSVSGKTGYQPILKLSFPVGPTGSLAISPDEKLLATGDPDGNIHIWNLIDGNQKLQFVGHVNAPKVKVKESSVNSLAFSEDGALLVSGGDDGMVKLWNPVTGALLNTLSGHTDPVFSVAISPNNKLIASSSGGAFDYTARLWDAQSGANIKIFPIEGIGYNVKFTPDGKKIITSGWGVVFKFDLATNKWDGQFEPPSKETPVRSIAVSSDSNYVFLAYQNIVDMWSLWTPTTDRPFPVTKTFKIPLSKSRTRLTNNEVIEENDYLEIKDIALTSDGKTLITSDSRTVKNDTKSQYKILFWDVETAKVFAELNPTDNDASIVSDTGIRIALSKDGKFLAGASPDGKVNVWNIGDQAQSLNSNKAQDVKPLIDSLEKLKIQMMLKVNSDLEITVRAFGESKDISRSLVMSDWFGTLLHLVSDTLSVIATAIDTPKAFDSLLKSGFTDAKGAAEFTAWAHAAYSLYQAQNQVDDGEKLQLALDGPAYGSAVKAMLQAAHDAACVTVLMACTEFNQAVYQTVIENQLKDEAPNMIVTLHKSGDARRKKRWGAKGVNNAEGQIVAKLQTTINALKAQGTVPDVFPMEETLDMLNRVRSQVMLSKGGSVIVVYDSLLGDGSQVVKHSEKVSLGRIGDMEHLRYVAVKHFADNMTIQLISTGKTIPDSIVNGLKIFWWSNNYKLSNDEEVIMTSYGYLTTMVDLNLAEQQKITTLDARKVIDYAPEEMLNSLGEELSDLWMIADDVSNKILLDAQMR